jgi:uncharacterized membrane protein YdfJ with MMPL/SSD domain
MRPSLLIALAVWSCLNWLWLFLVFVGIHGNLETMQKELSEGWGWIFWYNLIWLMPGIAVLFTLILLLRTTLDVIKLRD